MEIKMTNSSVGERIRSLRESRRLSRKDLAARAGLSAGYLYEIESGRRKFSAETLCRIAEALSVSCDYIMRGKEYFPERKEQERLLETLDSMSPGKIQRLRQMLELIGEMADLL